MKKNTKKTNVRTPILIAAEARIEKANARVEETRK